MGNKDHIIQAAAHISNALTGLKTGMDALKDGIKNNVNEKDFEKINEAFKSVNFSGKISELETEVRSFDTLINDLKRQSK